MVRLGMFTSFLYKKKKKKKCIWWVEPWSLLRKWYWYMSFFVYFIFLSLERYMSWFNYYWNFKLPHCLSPIGKIKCNSGEVNYKFQLKKKKQKQFKDACLLRILPQTRTGDSINSTKLVHTLSYYWLQPKVFVLLIIS